jgi:multiple sugar transport system ATP-binding protein
MGRAMVRQPQVFLMDEPLSNLDAKLRTQIRAEIAELQKRLRITTIYVTHDQTEAMTLGDRIAVLDTGRLQQVGPPQELYEQPANAFVAAFLGNPGMNIFPARLSRDRGMLQLESGGWHIPLEQLHACRPGLEECLEHPILVGLRPEAFSPELAPAYPAIVESIESLGHERLVYFRPAATEHSVGQKTLVARLPCSQAVTVGKSIKLGFRPEQLYFFTKEGEVLA